jgi:hypothetical protein
MFGLQNIWNTDPGVDYVEVGVEGGLKSGEKWVAYRHG